MGFVSFDHPRRRPGEAVLRFAVAVLTSLLVVALAGLTVVEVRPAWLAGLRNAVPAPAPASGPHANANGRTARHTTASGAHAPAHAAASATTNPTGPRSPAGSVGGGSPRLVDLRPATGAPGQHITVSGVNLFSADGRITLRFGGQSAPVRCASTHHCVATVPRLGGAARTTQVSLHTSGGISNTLSFHYR